MYQKEIIYIGLYKDGSRIGNAGFLKVENREQESRLDLQLRNIPFNIRGRFPIRIHNGDDWKEINGVSVQEGSGHWEENMGDRMQKVQLQIMMPGGYFLEGRSKSAPILTTQIKAGAESYSMSDSAKEERQAGTEPIGRGGKEERQARTEPIGLDGKKERQEEPVEFDVKETQRTAAEPKEFNGIREGGAGGIQSAMQAEAEIIPLHNVREKTQKEIQRAPRRETETVIITEELKPVPAKGETGGSGYVPELPVAYSLKEDKWEQILDSYEQIHPYGDERVYVRLEPKDFIILQSKYQHLVNNSFLLHGFYNYRYVILGKENDYYLGVPGVYYEREKMVALMFGFEAFECPGGIARAGEFGYYLRKVEL